MAIFATAMDSLGPFEPNPILAVAVSGGADSTALAVLAQEWVRHQGGSTLALVVDHGLRPASGDEARLTIERLTRLGIRNRLLPIADLKQGTALAARARIMRYQILTSACAEAGILHLLLGHHAADQVETLAMRVLRGSQNHGLAGMSALRETAGLRLLRPLLAVEPALLRHFLNACNVDWLEDPSNQDTQAMRPRLRQALAAAARPETGLLQSISAAGRLRSREEAETAAELATHVMIRPEGFALLSHGRIGAAALRCLIQTISGAPYPPSLAQVSELAAQPRPATVAGVRILAAGRFGNGLLVVREEAAIGEPVLASTDTIWDGRFRLIARHGVPKEAIITRLGADATRFRGCSDLPSTVLRTLPAVRVGKILAAVPHLGYTYRKSDVRMTVLFSPKRPIGGAFFRPIA